MFKKELFDNKGIIVQVLPYGKNVQIDMDKKGCQELIEILKDLLENPECSILEYDKESGYGVASGLLNSQSLGLIFSLRDK